MVSTITATQSYKQISSIVGKNLTHLFIYRLRNYSDLEAIIEEMSAIDDKKTLLQMHHEAIDGPYSLLYIILMQKDRKLMFMKKSEQYLVPCDNRTNMLFNILFSLYYI